MAQNNDGSLFPRNTGPYTGSGGSNDLFASEKPLAPPTSTFGESLVATGIKQAAKPPTKKELEAQAAADRARQVGLVSAQIDQMRTDPAWQGGSVDKRQRMYDSWVADTYVPMIKNIQDIGLRTELTRLPKAILLPDITAREKAVKDSSRLNDTWQGTKAATNSMVQGVADYYPAAAYQSDIDTIQKAKKENRPLTAREVMNLNESLIPLYVQGKTLDETLVGLKAGRDQQLKEAAETDKDIAANHAAQSIGQADRNLELKEDTARYGDFSGVWANVVKHPTNAIQLAVEQAPSMATAVAATAAGGLVGAAAAGSALSGQDAMSTAIQQVQQLPEAELIKLPEYKALIDSGMGVKDARNTLMLRAGNNAALLGAIVGLVTGPLGAEAGAGKLLSRVATKTVSDTAGKSAKQVVTGAVGKGLARTGMEGVEEGATQVAANYGQQQATGGDNSLLAGVGAAAAQGMVAGAPLGMGSEGISSYRDIKANTAKQDVAVAQTPVAQTPDGQISDAPTAAQAAEYANPPPDISPAANPTEVEGAVNTLRATFDDLHSRAGQTLTASEYNTLMEHAHSAEAAGVNITAIQAGLDGLSRGLPEGHPSATLSEAYKTHTGEQVQADSQSVATDIVSTLTAGETLDGRTTATTDGTTATTDGTTATTDGTTAAIPRVDHTGITTRDSINSELATPPTTGGRPAPVISKTTVSANPAVENTGVSRAISDSTTADARNQSPDAALGGDPTTGVTDSSPDNRAVPNTNAAGSNGERSYTGSTGQRPTDGGGTASASSSSVENILGLDAKGMLTIKSADGTPLGKAALIGHPVQYKGTGKNAKTITGTISGLRANGTFTLTGDNGGAFSNLPVKNIQGLGNTKPTAMGPTAMEPTAMEPTAMEPTAMEPTAMEPPVAAPVERAGQKGSVTPSGRSVSRMESLATRLYDMKDGAHATEAMGLSAAIARGDMAQVDVLADYLYAGGLRQFKPANESTGRAKATIDTAYTNSLNGGERLALQREFDIQQPGLPPELSTFSAFRDAMVHDALLTESGAAPINSVFGHISQATHNIVSKIAKALASIVFAITLSSTFPINDAVAAAGHGTVHTVTQTQGMSSVSSTVNSWVHESKDNAGQRYIIADKASGEIHIMDADGKVLATSPALYGSKLGDGMSIGETPAGIFTLNHEAAAATYGGDLQHFATASNGDVYAIHRVITSNLKQNRLGRLATKTGADNRVSLGCINIPLETYNKYLSTGFKGKLYIIPDQKALGDIFKGIEEVQAAQDLRDGMPLPMDLSDQTSDSFKSSTVVRAQGDPTGLSKLAEDIVDTEYSLANSPLAAKYNDPADTSNISYAAMLGLGLLRRRKTGGQHAAPVLGDTQPTGATRATQVPDAPQENWHVIAADTPSATTTASQRPGAIQRSVQAAAAARIAVLENLVDSQVSFIDWTKAAGLLPPGAQDSTAAPLVRELKLVPGVRDAKLSEYHKAYMLPLHKIVKAVSARLGRDPEIVARDMGIWTTLEHIPEANRELRSDLAAARDAVMFSPDVASRESADAALRAFDAYQAGKGTPVAMAGKLTDSQAYMKKAMLEETGYTREELSSFATTIRSGLTDMTQELLDAGVLPPEEVAQYKKFDFYVPLYTVVEEAGGDIYIGAGAFENAKDYKRMGAADHYASHAYVTFQQRMHKTAAAVASARFRYDLHTTYAKLAAQGDTKGLRRINMASGFISKEDTTNSGFFYREVMGTNADGSIEASTYKYLFDDPNILNNMWEANKQPNWALARPLTQATRKVGMAMTVLRPMFPPINWVRDGGEKTTSLASKYIYKNGKAGTPQLASSTEIALRVALRVFNPINVLAIAHSKITGDMSSPIVRSVEELKLLGGAATYQQQLARSTIDMQKELKQSVGWRRAPKGLMEGVRAWNDIWAEASIGGAYMALKRMGVPERDAAFHVLDTFNIHNRGMQQNNLQALYPFVGATIEGGRNIARAMSTPRGRKVIAASTLLSLGAYALMAGSAPDDDDYGNKLDAIPLKDLAGFMPFFHPDGSYTKVPVGFGISKITWILAAGVHRITEGKATAGEVASAVSVSLVQELQPLRPATDIGAENLIGGLMATIAPTIVAPLVQLGINQDNSGRTIHGTPRTGESASSSGRSATPQVWTDMAETMQTMTGYDTYPESIRHLAHGYLVGPLGAIITALESPSSYTDGDRQKTMQQLGPLWTAVGIQSVWDNGNTMVPRVYYKQQGAVTDILHKYGVSASDDANKGKGAGGAAITAANKILDAGGSSEDAMKVYYGLEATRKITKRQQQLRGVVKPLKSIEAGVDELSPVYEGYVSDREAIMREFLSATGGL